MTQGKGYPDLATRQMVKALSDSLPSTYVVPPFASSATIFHRVPFVTLVDGDAYGLDIASVYKFGSVTLRHESHKLAVPRIDCIGVWASELASQVLRACISSCACSFELGLESTNAHYFQSHGRTRKRFVVIRIYAAFTLFIVVSGAFNAPS